MTEKEFAIELILKNQDLYTVLIRQQVHLAKVNIMTYLKNIFSNSFFLLSCSSNLYVENYDPINKFLDTQNLNKNKVYILQSDKELNKQALRIFNGGEGSEHTINLTDPTDYTYGLFVEKYWKKMYTDYAGDTLKSIGKRRFS